MTACVSHRAAVRSRHLVWILIVGGVIALVVSPVRGIFNYGLREHAPEEDLDRWCLRVIGGAQTTLGFTNGVGIGARFQSVYASTAGPGTVLDPHYPRGTAIDALLTDSNNNCIRKVMRVDNTISTFSSTCSIGSPTLSLGTAASTTAAKPAGILYDDILRRYVVVASGSNVLYALDPASADSSLIAGSGIPGFNDHTMANLVRFLSPTQVELYNDLYIVADKANNRLRAVTPATGSTTSVALSGATGCSAGAAGSGILTAVSAMTQDLSSMFIVSESHHAILRVAADYAVTVAVGHCTTSGQLQGIGTVARFDQPMNIQYVFEVDAIVVLERAAPRIRVVQANSLLVTTLMVGATATAEGRFGNLAKIFIDNVNQNGLGVFPWGSVMIAAGGHVVELYQGKRRAKYNFYGTVEDMGGGGFDAVRGSQSTFTDSDDGNSYGALQFQVAPYSFLKIPTDVLAYSSDYTVCFKFTMSAHVATLFHLLDSSGGEIRFQIDSTPSWVHTFNGQSILVSGYLKPFACIVKEGANLRMQFLDDYTNELPRTIPLATKIDPTAIYVGTAKSGGLIDQFQGKMEWVTIYDYALTMLEVTHEEKQRWAGTEGTARIIHK